MRSLQVRDFIYLDVERLKSFIAQIEEGLINSSSEVRTTSRDASVTGSGGLLSFLNATVGSKYTWQNQATETRSLHDNIYNRVEKALIEGDQVIQIPDQDNAQEENLDEFREVIGDTSFVLAKGKVSINDYSQIQIMLERFNDIAKFIAGSSAVSTLPANASEQRRKQAMRAAQQHVTMDKPTLEGLKVVIDTFYKDRVVVKMMPFENSPGFRLVGNLDRRFFCDDLPSIIYKYGTAPVSEWMLFAQIASIPIKGHTNTAPIMEGSAIEVALQAMFDALREIEIMAQSVVYP